MTDFGFEAMEGRAEEFLLLLMLGAMIYSGVAYSQRGVGWRAKLLGWGALLALLIHALWLGAKFVQEGLRVGKPPRETPDVPVAYETWDLLGGAMTFLFGTAFLVCGVALVFLGWNERKAAGRGGKGKPKRA